MLGLALAFAPMASFAQSPSNTIGRILLDVERNGEAWYVLPDSTERVYLPDGNAAYGALRAYGLGITNADLAKIPVALAEDGDTDGDFDGLGDKLEEALGTNPGDNDSDDDGFNDGIEVTNGYDPNGPGRLDYDDALSARLKGKILIQVENLGQAWYVHPIDGKRYYMKDGAAAYAIMRKLGLGASSATISSIGQASDAIDCGENLECFIRATENDQPAQVDWITDGEVLGIYAYWERRLTTERNGVAEFTYKETTKNIRYYLPDEVRADLIANKGMTDSEIDSQIKAFDAGIPILLSTLNECTYGSDSGIVDVLRRWQEGNISTGVKLNFGGESTLTGDYEDIGSCVQKAAPKA